MGDRLLERHRRAVRPDRVGGRHVELRARGGDGVVAGVAVSGRAPEAVRAAPRVGRSQQSQHGRRTSARGGYPGQVLQARGDARLVVGFRGQRQALLEAARGSRHVPVRQGRPPS